MYENFLSPVGKIYRLIDVTDYDFSESEEGEVTEQWELIAENVYCRVDRPSTSSARTPMGIVEAGEAVGFFLLTEDIRHQDRFYYNFSGANEWYVVIDCTKIWGYDAYDHIETRISLMDRPTDGLWLSS